MVDDGGGRNHRRDSGSAALAQTYITLLWPVRSILIFAWCATCLRPFLSVVERAPTVIKPSHLIPWSTRTRELDPNVKLTAMAAAVPAGITRSASDVAIESRHA